MMQPNNKVIGSSSIALPKSVAENQQPNNKMIGSSSIALPKSVAENQSPRQSSLPDLLEDPLEESLDDLNDNIVVNTERTEPKLWMDSKCTECERMGAVLDWLRQEMLLMKSDTRHLVGQFMTLSFGIQQLTEPYGRSAPVGRRFSVDVGPHGGATLGAPMRRAASTAGLLTNRYGHKEAPT